MDKHWGLIILKSFNPLRQVKVRDGSVCGLSQIGDSCKGDSGSGLVYENPRTRNYEIVGIVSYGAGCNSTFNGDAIKLSEPRMFQSTFAGVKLPGVYTNIRDRAVYSFIQVP